jgi:hypothetical protein
VEQLVVRKSLVDDNERSRALALGYLLELRRTFLEDFVNTAQDFLDLGYVLLCSIVATNDRIQFLLLGLD